MTTKKQLKTNADFFAPYVSELARRMRLYDWTINISYKAPEDSGAAAEVAMTYGKKSAEIYLTEEFHTLSRQSQRHHLVHELVHCHWEPSVAPIRQQISDEAWAYFQCSFEYSIDAMAEVLAPSMPLPPAKK